MYVTHRLGNPLLPPAEEVKSQMDLTVGSNQRDQAVSGHETWKMEVQPCVWEAQKLLIVVNTRYGSNRSHLPSGAREQRCNVWADLINSDPLMGEGSLPVLQNPYRNLEISSGGWSPSDQDKIMTSGIKRFVQLIPSKSIPPGWLLCSLTHTAVKSSFSHFHPIFLFPHGSLYFRPL